MSQSLWEASSLERIPDEQRHQLDELLFTPAWDNIVIEKALQKPGKRTITGEKLTLLRLKYDAPSKVEVLPRLFQRCAHIKIRADILNKPYLVLYPWHKYPTPPPCVRLMDAMLAQSGMSPPAAPGAPKMCIAAPQSILLPAPAVASPADPTAAAAAAYLSAARALPLQQRRRLADALFMQAAAMHLFQMHSVLPPPALAELIWRDRETLEDLVSHGAPPGHPLQEDPAQPRGEQQGHGEDNGASDGPAATADPTHGWCEDYRTILKLSTIYPLKLQRHHVPIVAERPGLAVALLRRWAPAGSALRLTGGRRVSVGLLPACLNLTEYSDWAQVPPAQRADVQPLCMHPRTLAEAVIQLHANATKLYIRLEWEGLRQVMLSLDLVQSIAALACCVNEALLRFHVRSVNEKTYV